MGVPGCDMLTFSVYQQNFFSSTLLGSCEMPLSLCFEQLVSAAKSCDPTEVTGSGWGIFWDFFGGNSPGKNRKWLVNVRKWGCKPLTKTHMDSYGLIFSMEEQALGSLGSLVATVALSSQAGPLPIEVEMNLMYQTKPVLGRPWNSWMIDQILVDWGVTLPISQVFQNPQTTKVRKVMASTDSGTPWHPWKTQKKPPKPRPLQVRHVRLLQQRATEIGGWPCGPVGHGSGTTRRLAFYAREAGGRPGRSMKVLYSQSGNMALCFGTF